MKLCDLAIASAAKTVTADAKLSIGTNKFALVADTLNSTNHLHYDLGAGNEVSTFRHRFSFKCTYASAAGASARVFTLSTITANQGTSPGAGVYFYHLLFYATATNTFAVYVRTSENGTTASTSQALALNSTYYIDFYFDPAVGTFGSIIAKLYSKPSYAAGDLLYTVTKNLTMAIQPCRYMIYYDGNQGGSGTITFSALFAQIETDVPVIPSLCTSGQDLRIASEGGASYTEVLVGTSYFVADYAETLRLINADQQNTFYRCRDYGSSAIGACELRAIVTTPIIPATTTQHHVLALSDTLGDALANPNNVSVQMVSVGSKMRYSICERVAGAEYTSAAISYDFPLEDCAILKLTRTTSGGANGFGVLTLAAHNLSDYATAFSTVTLDAHSATAFRYLYSIQSRDTNIAGSLVSSYLTGLQYIGAAVAALQAEAISLLDTSIATRNAIADFTESIAFGDTYDAVVLGIVQAAQNESLTITDISAASAIRNADISEVISYNDAASSLVLGFVAAAYDDSLTVNDAWSASAIRIAAISEAIATTDSASAIVLSFVPAAQSEVISITDTQSASSVAGLAYIEEAISLVTVQDASRILVALQTEPISIADTQTAMRDALATQTETIGLGDSYVGLAIRPATAIETLVFNDAYGALTGGVTTLRSWFVTKFDEALQKEVPVTGLAPTYRLMDELTKLVYDHPPLGSRTFKAVTACVTPDATMIERDAVNWPGWYDLDLDTTTIPDGGYQESAEVLGAENYFASNRLLLLNKREYVPSNAQITGAPTAAENAAATLAAFATSIAEISDIKARAIVIEKLNRNDYEVDPDTGTITLRDDNGAVLFVGQAYSDAAGLVPYKSSDNKGVHRTSRLVPPA